MLKRTKNVYRIIISVDINLLLLNLLMTGDRFNLMDSEPDLVTLLGRKGIFLQGLVTIYIISLAIQVARCFISVFILYLPSRTLFLLHTLISIMGVIIFIFQISVYHSVFDGIPGKVKTNGVDFALGLIFLLYHCLVTTFDLGLIHVKFKDSTLNYSNFRSFIKSS